jgi:ATP adenylyltransferase
MAARQSDELEQGRLWELVDARVARAIERGSLMPLETERVVVEDCGVPFLVHVLAAIEAKQRERRSQERTGVNPFLPHDPDLWVCGLGPRHHCLLNKFNVLERHVLIVTRELAPQEAALERGDLEALARCMAEGEALGWYNAGEVAGASQEHRHLQVVPVPLGEGPEATPVDVVLDASQLAAGRIEAFGFVHAVAGMELDWTAPAKLLGQELEKVYQELMRRVGLWPGSRTGDEVRTEPYNLLVTRRWMLLVPRRQEHFGRLSINALAFAGSLLVRNQEELAAVRASGPMTVLQKITVPERSRP